MMKIVIFDMDGTLINSKKDITIAINHIRKINHSLEPLQEDYVAEVINMQERNLPYLFYTTPTYEMRDKELFELVYKEQCVKNLFLYDGVLELLNDLVLAGVKISVATNAPSFFAKRMLEHLNIASMFDMIVGADMVKSSKPDPKMLKHILDFYGYDSKKDSAFMVGDSEKDIQSAKNISIMPIFVKWGFSKSVLDCVEVDTPKRILDIVLEK